MQANEVTWALVALTAVQVTHAIFTAWFAAMESRCQQELTLLKAEVASMRHIMSREGEENRKAIADNRQAIVTVWEQSGGGGTRRPPSAP